METREYRKGSNYPYKSHFQWLRAVYAFVGCSLFILFNGWDSFLGGRATADKFLPSYISVSSHPSYFIYSRSDRVHNPIYLAMNIQLMYTLILRYLSSSLSYSASNSMRSFVNPVAAGVEMQLCYMEVRRRCTHMNAGVGDVIGPPVQRQKRSLPSYGIG
jgi:hypothetical protein